MTSSRWGLVVVEGEGLTVRSVDLVYMQIAVDLQLNKMNLTVDTKPVYWR